MKKYKYLFLTVIFLLVGCCVLQKNNNTGNDPMDNIVAKLTIADVKKEEPYIPNPCEVVHNSKISLPYFGLDQEEPNEYLIDLSFLGFNKKVKLTAYEVVGDFN